jgi:hypothetical protein
MFESSPAHLEATMAYLVAFLEFLTRPFFYLAEWLYE